MIIKLHELLAWLNEFTSQKALWVLVLAILAIVALSAFIYATTRPRTRKVTSTTTTTTTQSPTKHEEGWPFYLKLNPFGSIFVAIFLSVLVAFFVNRYDPLLGIGTLIFALGASFSGSVTIPIQHEGVLKVFGMRFPVKYTEGWHPLIYKLMVVDKSSTRDMREQVVLMPQEDEKNGKGEKREGFPVIAGVNRSMWVEFTTRAVLRYKPNDSYALLSYDPEEIVEGLTNKTVDLIRAFAAEMTDTEFVAEKKSIAEKIKEEIDGIYGCITVTSVDIPKAVPADADLAKAKQELAKQKALTEAQYEDFLGEKGLLKKIELAQGRLAKAGLSQADAARLAVELIQGQEKIADVRVQRFEGIASALGGVAAAIAATKGSPTTPTK